MVDGVDRREQKALLMPKAGLPGSVLPSDDSLVARTDFPSSAFCNLALRDATLHDANRCSIALRPVYSPARKLLTAGCRIRWHFTKDANGRIDDPNGGWKGRGLWTTSGTRTNFHGEGGVAAQPKVFKLQIRPNPLAG